MFKKITATVIAVLLGVSLLALNVLAGAMNPAEGCKVEVNIKKAAPGAVVHDGVISEDEYTEIEINRDSDTTDMLLSWSGSGDLLLKACDFLKNVHYYISWDDNGVNFAAQATLLEDPFCDGTMPTQVDEYVGDEFFMFHFGFMAKIENPDDINNEYLYRTIGINTETGELLIGSYWADGHTGSLNLTAGQDYNVKVDGRTVTYEISYPLESVLEADQLRDGKPIDGEKFYFTLSLTGGSPEGGWDAGLTYAVSLGDGGYMTVSKVIGAYSGAVGVISSEPVIDAADDTGNGGGNTGTGDDTTGGDGGTTPAGPSNEQGQTVVIDPDQYEVRTDDDGNEVIIDKKTGEEVDVNTLPVAPAKTGDPMIVMAAVAAVSAAGAFIVKKRRS